MRRPLARLVLPLTLITASILNTGATARADSYQSDWLSRINTLRASKNLRPLTLDPTLSAFAQNWADHLAASGVLAHNPDLANAPGAWSKLGENVGAGTDVATVFAMFITSAHHYENLVDPAYTTVGIGTAVATNGAVWTAHDFEARSVISIQTATPTTTRSTSTTTTRPVAHIRTTQAAPVTTTTLGVATRAAMNPTSRSRTTSAPEAPTSLTPQTAPPDSTTTAAPPPAAPARHHRGKHHRTSVLHRIRTAIRKLLSTAHRMASLAM